MKTGHIVTFMLLASFVLQASCSSAGRHGQATTGHRPVQNQSGSARYPYELPDRAEHLSISLTVTASAGSFIYSVTDPLGAPAWQGRVDEGQKLDESRTLKPLPGKWVLTLTLENATGGYDITWSSK